MPASLSTVRLTQNGQGGGQTSTPVSGTTSYTYQVVFPDAVQLCALHTNSTPQYPSACVAGWTFLITLAIVPLASMTNVERWMPMYVRP